MASQIDLQKSSEEKREAGSPAAMNGTDQAEDKKHKPTKCSISNTLSQSHAAQTPLPLPPLVAIYRSGALVGVGALYTLEQDTLPTTPAPTSIPKQSQNLCQSADDAGSRAGKSVTVLGTSHHAMPPDALIRGDTELRALPASVWRHEGANLGTDADIDAKLHKDNWTSKSSATQRASPVQKASQSLRLDQEKQCGWLGFHFADYVLDVSLVELTSDGLEAVRQLLAPCSSEQERQPLIPYRVSSSDIQSYSTSVPNSDFCLVSSENFHSREGMKEMKDMALQLVGLERLEGPYLSYKSSSKHKCTRFGVSGTPTLSIESSSTSTSTIPTLTALSNLMLPVAIHNGRFVQESLHGLLPRDSPLRRRATLWSHILPLFWRERTRFRLSRWLFSSVSSLVTGARVRQLTTLVNGEGEAGLLRSKCFLEQTSKAQFGCSSSMPLCQALTLSHRFYLPDFTRPTELDIHCSDFCSLQSPNADQSQQRTASVSGKEDVLLIADSLNCCVRLFSPLRSHTLMLYESNATLNRNDWIESPVSPTAQNPILSGTSTPVRVRKQGVVSENEINVVAAASSSHSEAHGYDPSIDPGKPRPPSLTIPESVMESQCDRALKQRSAQSLRSTSNGTRHVYFASNISEKMNGAQNSNGGEPNKRFGSILSKLTGITKSKSCAQSPTSLEPFGERHISSVSGLSNASSVSSVTSIAAPLSQKASWCSLLAGADPDSPTTPTFTPLTFLTSPSFRHPVAVRYISTTCTPNSGSSALVSGSGPFKSGSGSMPFVTGSGFGPGLLLVVERESRVWPVRYSIAVVDLSTREVRERHTLPVAALSTRMTSVDTPHSWAPVSAYTTSDGSWLVGVAGASALAVLDSQGIQDILVRDALNERLYTMELENTSLGVFAIRTTAAFCDQNSSDVIAILQLLKNRIAIMKLIRDNSNGHRLQLSKLSELVIGTALGTRVDRLLFYGNTILAASRDETRAVHSVFALDIGKTNGLDNSIVGAGKWKEIQLEDFGADLRIGCWRIIKDKLILWDSNHLQLLAFELNLHESRFVNENCLGQTLASINIKVPESLMFCESFRIPVSRVTSPNLRISNALISIQPSQEVLDDTSPIKYAECNSQQPSLAFASGPSNTLLVVDMLRCDVRELNTSTLPVVCRTVFRSALSHEKRIFLRGAVFVPACSILYSNDETQNGTLVAVEMEPLWEWHAMLHRALLCPYANSSASNTAIESVGLQHFPRTLHFESFLNTGVLSIGGRQLLLTNLNATSELEVLHIVAPSKAIALHALRLGFTQFCFTAATVRGTPLLFAAELQTPEVRVLEVQATGGSLNVQLLRRLPMDCQRICWNYELGLLCAMRNDKRDGMTIAAWKVVNADVFKSSVIGSRNRFEWELASDSEFGYMLSTWSCIGNKLAIYDKNNQLIKVMEYLHV